MRWRKNELAILLISSLCTGTLPHYLANRADPKKEGRHGKKNAQKYRYSHRMSGEGWEYRDSWRGAPIGASPETKYKRSKNVFAVTSIALSLGHLGARLLRLPVQCLTRSPGNPFSLSHFRWHIRMLFQSSKLEARMSILPSFSEKRRLSFEFWALKRHSKMYSRSHSGWHFRMMFQSSKLKARTSLFTETWQKRRSRYDLWAFENVTEEEEGIGIASDVVKVKGEDPATPGCLREVRVRWCVGDFQSWVRTLLACSGSWRNPGTVHWFPKIGLNKRKQNKWDWLYSRSLGVTFSNAVSKQNKFTKLKDLNACFATFQWKETFELWALSFEKAFAHWAGGHTPKGYCLSTNEPAPSGRGVHLNGHRPYTLTNEPAPFGRVAHPKVVHSHKRTIGQGVQCRAAAYFEWCAAASGPLFSL